MTTRRALRARRPDLRFRRRALREDPYPLPLSLTIGDEVLIEGTGAYTTTYSSPQISRLQRLRAAALLRHLTAPVEATSGGKGIGSALMRHAIIRAEARGHGGVILVGDASYYQRFGFSSEKTGALTMPGPVERHRLLGLEIKPGYLDELAGLLVASGQRSLRRNNGDRAGELKAA
jgi:GNAT superfamily N-acetyltransferase